MNQSNKLWLGLLFSFFLFLGVNAWADSNNGVRFTGAQTPTHCVQISATNVLADSGSTCGSGGGGSSALSAITSATTSNTIDNAANAQTWTWNSLTTGTAFSLTTSTATSGKQLDVEVNNAASTGYAGYFSNTGTNGAYAVYANGALKVTSTFTAPTFTNALGSITTHTMLAAEMGMSNTTSGASAIAITLPQAGTAGFANGVGFGYINLGAGTATFTPTTSTVNGAATLAFTKGQGGYFYSNAAGNWDVNLGAAPTATSSVVGLVRPDNSTITISSGVLTATVTGAANQTLGSLTTANPYISGDVTSGFYTAGAAKVDVAISGVKQAEWTTGGSSFANTTTVNNLTITGTCTGCGSGAAFTPVLQPMSATTTDTAGNLFPYTYFDSTTTGATALGSPSWGVAASLGADTVLRWRFKMPPTLPASGTLNLCTLCQANATSGVVKYTVRDSVCAVNNTCSVGATVLTAETQTSITWSAADNYVETCTPLTNTPGVNGVSIGAITFNTSSWTLAQILSCNITESWR